MDCDRTHVTWMLKIEKAKLEHFLLKIEKAQTKKNFCHVSFDKDIKLIKYKLDKNIKFISMKYLSSIS